jgi:predicted acylesterase/phospholipase RssA
VVSIYEENAKTIFERYSEIDDGVLFAKYKNDGIRALASEALGQRRTMSALGSATRNVAVVSAQLWDPTALKLGNQSAGTWKPRFISSLPGSPYLNLDPVDAALATSAAPSYFPPVEISGVSTSHDSFYVDGGVVANNPLAYAIAEVVKAEHATLDEIRVISIGTATSSFGITNAQVEDHEEGPYSWGAGLWLDPIASGTKPAMPLLELALSMNEELSTSAASAMLGKPNQAGTAFLRAEPVIKPYAMDDYKDIAQLENDVTTYIGSDEWAQIVKLAPAVWGT